MPGFAPGKIPLADDPALVGADLSFQWLVLVGDGVAVSDVVSAKVMDHVIPPPGMESFFLPSAAPGNGPGGASGLQATGQAAGQSLATQSAAMRAAAIQTVLGAAGAIPLSAEVMGDFTQRLSRPRPGQQQ